MKPGDLIQVSDPACPACSDAALLAAPELRAGMTEHQLLVTRGPVCIIDDDVGVCDSLSVLLEAYGFTVLIYTSGADFLQDHRHRTAKCLVIDHHMPGLNGLDVVGALQRGGVFPPVILITGRLDAAIAQRAEMLGIRAVLEKPFPVARLVELIRGSLTAPA